MKTKLGRLSGVPRWNIISLNVNQTGGTMINMLASSVVDRRFKLRSGHTKDSQLVFAASPLSM
jgi:hypothetical protein